ncbi:MAG: divalent metal cation transporter [Armatimonadetes bacterium]|nr:divalent metal cation transporter [Armatimonadota bacterium]
MSDKTYPKPNIARHHSPGVEGSRTSGPGWLLSAYTLGSGTAVGSLWAGATYGYDLLWVQPLAILMGVVVLSGAAYFTLQSNVPPYHRFKQELHPAMAVAWAVGSLFASVIWHFPQYGLAFAATQELLGFEETLLAQVLVAGCILAVSIIVTWTYSRKGGVRVYEAVMKALVWMVIVCLGIVIAASKVPWDEVGRGLVSFRRPEGSSTIILGLLGAAVGINMTFLYPYSVRSKGWGRSDTRYAIRDLVYGMFLPFVIATGMMIIASAATLYANDVALDKAKITAMASVFTPVFGNSLGPILFNLGILAMPLSTITLHMLTCGFIISEMTSQSVGSLVWRVGTLIPAIGALGVAFPIKGWLPVAASALCLIFIPIAYVGFVILFAKESRKPDAPKVSLKPLVLVMMSAIIAFMTFLALLKTVDAIRDLIRYF